MHLTLHVLLQWGSLKKKIKLYTIILYTIILLYYSVLETLECKKNIHFFCNDSNLCIWEQIKKLNLEM